jgi:hypothetical protein
MEFCDIEGAGLSPRRGAGDLLVIVFLAIRRENSF